MAFIKIWAHFKTQTYKKIQEENKICTTLPSYWQLVNIIQRTSLLCVYYEKENITVFSNKSCFIFLEYNKENQQWN